MAGDFKLQFDDYQYAAAHQSQLFGGQSIMSGGASTFTNPIIIK
jgi:hypothetical protein